jgi:hypothetical protein
MARVPMAAADIGATLSSATVVRGVTSDGLAGRRGTGLQHPRHYLNPERRRQDRTKVSVAAVASAP